MKLLTGGATHIAKSLEDDLKKRRTVLNKAKVKGLADLAATALQSRSCHSHECDKKSKERYINRFLFNESGEITPVDAHKLKLSELKEDTFNNTDHATPHFLKGLE